MNFCAWIYCSYSLQTSGNQENETFRHTSHLFCDSYSTFFHFLKCINITFWSKSVQNLTDEIVHQSYTNALDLLIGNTDFDTLSEQDEFYLPQDYDDESIVLQYFEDIEDYETCIKIRDKQSHKCLATWNTVRIFTM